MFINAFWLGVLATLAAEFIIVTVHTIICDLRGDDYDEEEENK